MNILLIIVILLAVIIIVMLSSLIKQNASGKNKDRLVQEIGEGLQQHLQNANNQLVLMAGEKLSAEQKNIATDLTNKKEAIEKMVQRVLDDLKQTEDKRISSFTQLKTELENNQKITEQLSATTESLRKVLSNNQLRGQFGEQVAEDLLKMAGFVKGTDYEFNKQQSSNTRPDFTVFLPDKTKINIDAKFPYENLQRATETQNESQKKEYLRLFATDIKQKIKQVTSRDYINPDERTVDFVILFIPNEMIFSFIYDKLNDVWSEAMRQKVVLAGPFSFTAILRMIHQAHDVFKYQKNTREIIGLIKKFEIEFDKFNEEFDRVGKNLELTAKQFEKVSTTRTRQLTRTIDKINLIEPEKAPLIDDHADINL